MKAIGDVDSCLSCKAPRLAALAQASLLLVPNDSIPIEHAVEELEPIRVSLPVLLLVEVLEVLLELLVELFVLLEVVFAI